MVFGKDRKKYTFTINDEVLQKVKRFKYLGTIFTTNGRYAETIKHNIRQASKAAFSISKRSRELNLSPSCEIHILNTIVKPILLYNCEIFSIENTIAIENFYLRCLKRILKVNKSTPAYMVYGETGCTPIQHDIVLRTLSFFLRTFHNDTNSLSHTLLSSLFNMYDHSQTTSKYLYNIETMLNELPLGFSFLLTDPLPAGVSLKQMIKCIKHNIYNQYMYIYRDTLDTSKKLFYKSIKEKFQFEPYLDILPLNLRVAMTRFRMSNHKLPIETGRWRGIPRNDRICPKCQNNVLGDEHHFLFECPTFLESRSKLMKRYYYNNPSVYKSQSLFISHNKHTLSNLAIFIITLMKQTF